MAVPWLYLRLCHHKLGSVWRLCETFRTTFVHTILKAGYEKLHESLHTKRYQIVNGVVEVKGDNMGTGDEKGVPNFWLTALKSYVEYEEEIYYISKRDEEALKFLKDIKWCRVDHPKGFKLDFFFDTNPFFQESCIDEDVSQKGGK